MANCRYHQSVNVQLEWPPEVVERLKKEAREKGVSLDEYVLDAVLKQAGNGAADTADSRQRQEAGRSIRELRKGNILGPDLTIRDLIDEGRRF